MTTVAALALASPVSGHHSDAGLEMDSVVTFEGTVTEFNWRNPHVYFTVESTNERGEQIDWVLQMGSTIVVTRMGWTRESLSIGDRVTVGAHAARNGRPYGLLDSIEKEGGIILPTSFDRGSAEPLLAAPEATASTATLEGIWMADLSKLVSYPGGLDGFFIAQLNLTEKGQTARASYDEISAENPGSRCIGMPTPVTIVTTNLYPLEIKINADEETIMIRSEYFDAERTVYLDGRGHPEGGERIFAGHSIGWWEGDTLVVDTRNFADHRSAYQTGVPSGAQKHVVERYRLTEDGTRIALEFMLEDPEYITEPMTHTRELIYSPQMELSRFDCDPEATRRFLPQ
jgi:hypothetical protein